MSRSRALRKASRGNRIRLAGAGVGAALAAAASMSAGVPAREMIIVNGDREIAARFVIVERSELIYC